MVFSSLSPADGEVTLRSLPRRFREVFAGPKRRARAEVVGPDGVSALDLLDQTVGTLAVLERAVEQVDTADQPALHPGVVDATQREFAGSASVDDALDGLEAVATSFADRVASISGDAWARTGTVAGRTDGNGRAMTVTALQLLQEAATVATDDLRAADRLLATADREP